MQYIQKIVGLLGYLVFVPLTHLSYSNYFDSWVPIIHFQPSFPEEANIAQVKLKWSLNATFEQHPFM